MGLKNPAKLSLLTPLLANLRQTQLATQKGTEQLWFIHPNRYNPYLKVKAATNQARRRCKLIGSQKELLILPFL